MADSSPSTTLIVTATIKPAPDVPKLAVRDPVERLGHYLDAWPHHLAVAAKHNAGVVLVENSGADLAIFAERSRAVGFAGPIEFLSLPETPGALGRGYGELKLLEATYVESMLVASVPDDALVWKVTGRYQVTNMDQLMGSAPKVDIYCNLRRVPAKWIDQYAFAASRRGFGRYIRPAIEALASATDAPSSETVLFDAIFPHRFDPAIAPRFRYEPHLIGISGWNREAYDGPLQRTSYRIRSVVRRLAPTVWI